MKHALEAIVRKASALSHVSGKTVEVFTARLQTPPFTRSEGEKEHFCAFFLPVSADGRSVYLVHHKKAQDWIPPGGHIEKDEHPRATVQREFTEELGHTLTTEPMYLFDLTVKPINKPQRGCITHFDIWFVVPVQKKIFRFCTSEFYTAAWFEIGEGLTKIKRTAYRDIIAKLEDPSLLRCLFGQKPTTS